MIQDPEKAPKYITDAIDGSSYEGTFGAPLDRLLNMKKVFEDKTDEEKDKLRKVTLYITQFMTGLINYFRKPMMIREMERQFAKSLEIQHMELVPIF